MIQKRVKFVGQTLSVITDNSSRSPLRNLPVVVQQSQKKPIYDEFDKEGFGDDVRVKGIEGGSDIGLILEKLLVIFLCLSDR